MACSLHYDHFSVSYSPQGTSLTFSALFHKTAEPISDLSHRWTLLLIRCAQLTKKATDKELLVPTVQDNWQQLGPQTLTNDMLFFLTPYTFIALHNIYYILGRIMWTSEHCWRQLLAFSHNIINTVLHRCWVTGSLVTVGFLSSSQRCWIGLRLGFRCRSFMLIHTKMEKKKKKPKTFAGAFK